MAEGVKTHGDGIYSRYSKRAKRRIYSVQYYWRGKRITERVGTTEDGVFVPDNIDDAKKLRRDRRIVNYDPEFVPPHLEAKVKKQEAETEADARRPLIYEAALGRFLEKHATEYSDPEEIKRRLGGALELAFTGRYLDEITKVDIRRYYEDRLTNTGPFKSWPRKVGMRAPQTEVSALSAVFTLLQDEGHAIENPCHRPQTRRKKKGLFRPYQPKHEAVVPSPEALEAIFAAKRNGQDQRALITDPARVFWKLCYYTAARPESEPCRLLHGDVEPSDGETWGAVTYRNTKTGGDRRVLLHPEVERDLRAIMRPLPMDAEARERWKLTPIFRKRSSGKAWDRSSYPKAWGHALDVAGKEHPELAGMWTRDLRPTAKTVMINAGASELAVNRILGHQDGVAGRYYRLSDKAMRDALQHLTLKRAAVSTAGHVGRLGQYVEAGDGAC